MLVMLLMLVTPGANQILVFQSGLNFGHKAAIYNVAGITASMFVHMMLSGLGVALVMLQSPSLLSLFKGLGCIYLMYLALSGMASARRTPLNALDQTDAVQKSGEEKGRGFFAKGFTTNVLNIQTSLVFLSIFPQYMNQDQSLLSQSLFLTLIFIAMLVTWYSLLIALIFRIRRYLLDSEVQRMIKMATSSLLLVTAIVMLLK